MLPVSRIVTLLAVTSALTITPIAQAAPAFERPSAVATSPAAKVSAGEAKWERKILTLTNRKRAAHDCKPLTLQKNLRKAARKHSDKMAAANTLSHQLPGEPSLGTRITRAGYTNWRAVAENVAYGYPSPASMMKAWMNSPGHRKNILNCSYRHLGVGVTVKSGVPWATQNFGRK